MASPRSLVTVLLVGIVAFLTNLALVSAGDSPNGPDCPQNTTGDCTLTFTTHYWPGDGLFHMNAAVYDKNCAKMARATYIYKKTTLKGELPHELSFHNFTQASDTIRVWFKYNGKLMEHKADNCTHKPNDHVLICPQTFKC
ncbi:hypothetical protein KEM52_000805 [Ascosphaera acerosa]|nr:hypothetical protein KEM52_000805 [Ascosphaera acerosa]